MFFICGIQNFKRPLGKKQSWHEYDERSNHVKLRLDLKQDQQIKFKVLKLIINYVVNLDYSTCMSILFDSILNVDQ